MKETQKIAIPGTAHILRRGGSADVNVQNIFQGRNNMTSSIICKYRTAATLHVYPINMVCFGFITINTPNKGDMKDNNNINNNNRVSPL